MIVTLYARVSTDHQSVDDKMKELRRWAVSNGHTIGKEVFDTESGTIDLKDRKKFLEILENPIGEALVTNKLDRLTRNYDSVSLIEKYFRENWDNFKLITLDFPVNLGNATGRFLFRQMMNVACYEPELMKERQKLGIARAKKQGKFKGRQKGAKGKGKKSKPESVVSKSGEVK